MNVNESISSGVITMFLQAGGGRNEVDPRFLSLFSVYNVTFPSSKSLHHIYSSIITGHLIPFNKGMSIRQYFKISYESIIFNILFKLSISVVQF